MPDRRVWSEHELDAALAAFRADVAADPARMQRLRERFVDDASGPQRGGRAGGSGARSRVLVAVAAAAAVAAAVSGVVVVGGAGSRPAPGGPPVVAGPAAPGGDPVPPGGDPVPPDGTPVPAAELGRNASDPEVGPGQYLYRRTEYAAGPVIEEWIPADRSDEWLMRGSPDSEIGELRAPYGEYLGPRGEQWHRPSQEFLAELPRDPQALAERLQTVPGAAPHDDPPDHAALTAVADLLRSTPVAAELRAALFAALDHVPGIEAYLQDRGRQGVLRVDWESGTEPLRYELLVDMATGQMGGERTGTPGSDSTVTIAVADELGVAPPG